MISPKTSPDISLSNGKYPNQLFLITSSNYYGHFTFDLFNVDIYHKINQWPWSLSGKNVKYITLYMWCSMCQKQRTINTLFLLAETGCLNYRQYSKKWKVHGPRNKNIWFLQFSDILLIPHKVQGLQKGVYNVLAFAWRGITFITDIYGYVYIKQLWKAPDSG